MAESHFQRVGILGAGSWGTALATVLAERGLQVRLWGHDPAQIRQLQATRLNQEYLPGVPLSENISFSQELSDLADSDFLLFVVPSAAMREVAAQAKSIGLRPGVPLVSCTKGIELETGERMTEVMGDELPGHPLAVLSGPSHAEEVGKRLPTAVVVGSEDAATATSLQEVFTLPWFRSYTSEDVRGIEYGGAIKNVFAIAAGACEGLRLGDNSKAGLVTRGLAEMVRLGTCLGGKPQTFYGLSGMGDLVVTCYSAHSRNAQVGLQLGQGQAVEEVLKGMKMVAEGVPNTRSIHRLVQQMGAACPIIEVVYQVIYEQKSSGKALHDLLSRDPKAEVE
ncbi:MAG: NAD(P)H-dependent glycerol-3-phosphate dehydrogenase [Verrucomicrobiota bacterium]